MSSVAFRLTIYQANGTTPDLTMTSIRSGTNPYIVGVPSGDGQEVDLLTGAVRSGAYNIEVADVVTGSDGTGTVRLITNKLEDANLRQQLLSRRAKLEMSRNNGSTWSVWIFGYLTGLRQIDAITYGFTVSDSRRIESTHTAFTWSADANAATDERREFPNRGCLIGGPMIQNFGPLRASGGWEYAWKEVQGSYLALSFLAAYNAPSYARNNTMNVIAFFNALRPFFQSLPPIANLTGTNFEQIRERQYVFGFPAVMAIVTSGSSVWYGTVRAAHTPPAPGQNGQGQLALPTFGEMNYIYIELDPGQSTSYPSANAPVRVQLLQKEVSSASPLYINEHPVDIVSKLYETVNIPFSSSSATTVKAIVGDDVRLALRITEPVNLGQFLAQSIFGPFGFSARTNASGEQEFFATRISNASTPTTSITDDDVVGDNPPPIFEVDESSVVTSFRLTAKSLAPFVPDPTGSLQAPPDGLVEVETSQVVQNGDTSTYSTREVAYRFPGMVHDGSVSGSAFTLSPEVVGRFFTGIVAEGFDRFGRGAIASEVQVLATASAASLQVGDEVLVDVGYYPNKNYRIGESSVGSRIAQIVRRTEAPEGPIFKLIDSGVNAQPTAPTFTVASFAGDPRRVAAVTVTNAATLNTAGATLAVQYQVSASSPTKTGTLFTRFRPGTIPTVAFTLPAVAPGSTVWVRMRTERTEYRASAWTAWTSVALDAWIAPASLTIGTKTANSVALSWSLGSPTTNTIDPLDVFAYKGASAPADWTGYRVGSLANGSTSITVRDLDASTQYTFGVAFKDEGSGAYSSFATATTTTNAVNTVQAPAAPKMKVYTSFPDAGTTTGVALAIGAVEGYNIVVQRAADSSGSPGAWKEIALLAPLTPIFVDPLPSDGATRWYRVFYRLSGFLDGTPGTARSATPIAIPDELVGQNASIISGGATLTFGSYLVGTPDSFYDGATSQSLAVDATSAATANKVVARDNTGSFSANTVTATLDGPAPAGQLTGSTLAANVLTSSLTAVGTIGTGVWEGTSVGKNYGGTGLTSSAFTGVTNERVFAYDGGSGAFFLAPSGSNGQALVYTGGALAWGNPAPGSHVLADTTGLGAQHTTSGLTTGMILQATGATTARFQTPSIPASSVTAGTFSGASYTITNDLTVSGTLTGTLTGNITGNAATVTNGVYTTGSYADPSWITSLAGSKISGNISGSAANVTGTVAIANGGTNATSYGTSGTGTRALVYSITNGAFEAVAAGSSGQFLQSAGTTGDITWATPPTFTSSAAGYAPASGGGTSNFLRADGTWAVPAVGSVSANNVTAGTFSGANYYFTNNVRFDSGARVAFGYGYTIDNAGGSPVSVLTATTLGTGVVNSSLTSVGTLTSGAIGSGFTAIANSALANSAITINGTSVSLGGSITVDTSKWTASGSNIYYSTGNVSIGTTPSASFKLYVRGGGATAATYGFLVENSAATSTFWVNDAGNVSIPNGTLGIGTSPGSNRLTVNGTTQTTAVVINGTSAIGTASLSIYAGGSGGVAWSSGVNIGDGTSYLNFIQDVGISRWRNFGTGGFQWFSSGGFARMNLNDAGDFEITERASINTSAWGTTAAKFLVGAYLSNGSSAIAQFNGFLRIRNQLFIHDDANIANSGSVLYDSTGLRLISSAEGAGSRPVRLEGAAVFIPQNTWVRTSDVNLLRDSYFGYSSGYRAVQVGLSGGSRAISLGVDLTGNASGNFNGKEIVIPNDAAIIAPNAANNNYVGVLRVDSSNNICIGGADYTTAGRIYVNNSTGNVGIGATSLSYRLQVEGNVYANGSVLARGLRSANRGELFLNGAGTTDVAEIFFGYGNGFNESQIRWGISDRGTTDASLIIYKGPANGGFGEVIKISAGTTNTITVTGNVGIGTTPSFPLHVSRAVSGDWAAKIINTSSTNPYGLSIETTAGGGSTFPLAVYSYSGTGFFVTNSGNVGIGLTSPYGKLSVTGAHASGRGIVDVRSSDAAFICADTATTDGGLRLQVSGVDKWLIGIRGSDNLYFNGSSDTTRVAFMQSGAVGIGTTSFGTSATKLAVGAVINSATSAIAQFDGFIRVRDNVFIHSANSDSAQIAYDTTGLKITTSAEGASGRIISLLGGNVGIGTTSPNGTLDVGKSVTTPSIKLGNSNYGNSYESVWGVQSGAQSIMIFGNNASNEIRAGNTGSGGYLDIITNNTAAFTSAHNGNLNARFASSGATYFGTTTSWASAKIAAEINSTSAPAAEFNGTGQTAGLAPVYIWNNAESGSTYFISFYSDGVNNARTLRGYINYRRDNATLNLTTASDYRIKTIHGPYTKSGEVFDKLQIHEGTINGETGRFPMAVAHELQEAYAPAVEGEKDAVNEDGSPKLQMVSYVAMIPVMLAEIKSLRERVAQLETMS